MSETKPSLKERLANLRSSKTSTHKEAKTRVASAWTLAKSMLPTAPAEVQYKLASSLLSNSTQALTAMLRQTAINAHYTKVAEKFEQIHKVELNEFLEDESVLNKLKNEIKSELKGEAKNASAECKCSGAGCPECDESKKTAAPEENIEENNDVVVNEEVAPEAGNKELPPVDGEMPPAEGEVTDLPPTDEVPPVEGEATPGAEGAIPDAKKEELTEKIDNLEADIQALEEAVEGEEELDFSKIFDDEDMEDKTDSLANEDEGFGGEEEEGFDMESADAGAQFFTDAEALEGTLDGQEPTTDMSDFFPTASLHATASLDSMLADSKTASEDIVEKGELGEEWLDEGGVPDAAEDHEDVILYEVLKTLKVDKYDPGAKRIGEPKLEAPKAAAKTASKPEAKTIRSLGNVKTAATNKDQAMLASLVFPGEQEW